MIFIGVCHRLMVVAYSSIHFDDYFWYNLYIHIYILQYYIYKSITELMLTSKFPPAAHQEAVSSRIVESLVDYSLLS